jgi:hypothetical protein
MQRILEADTHSLTLRLAGSFTATEDLYRDGDRAHGLTQQLLEGHDWPWRRVVVGANREGHA